MPSRYQLAVESAVLESVCNFGHLSDSGLTNFKAVQSQIPVFDDHIQEPSSPLERLVELEPGANTAGTG